MGLGLAIVRLLIEADGGRVGYRAGVPAGAAFSFALPGYLDPVAPLGATTLRPATGTGLASPAP